MTWSLSTLCCQSVCDTQREAAPHKENTLPQVFFFFSLYTNTRHRRILVESNPGCAMATVGWISSAHGPQCYKNEHPTNLLRSTNGGCCLGQAYNVSILRVMVMVAADGSGDALSVHAEADEEEERARSFLITRQGRPFILPPRWNDSSPRIRRTDSRRGDTSRTLPRKSNPMVLFSWRMLWS